MKLTVSSTAMMKPLLHTDHFSLCKSPPQRVVGLLEASYSQHHQDKRAQKLVQYFRPDPQHALLQTAKWDDFLWLDNAKNLSCAAVFGFVFDGTRAWYQVWNHTTDRPCWLLHNNEMNYEPFAILTMDALVSLLPNWDGTSHQSPASSNNPQTAGQKPQTIDAGKIRNLIISDASTSAAGKLWFLVTINANRMGNEIESNTIPTRSGWISPTI